MTERRDLAPLSGGFFAASIIGLVISVIYFEKLGVTWGTTFFLFFIIMFIASFRSMHSGPAALELQLDHQNVAETKVHTITRNPKKVKKKRRKKRK